jgi:hypothetical protein
VQSLAGTSSLGTSYTAGQVYGFMAGQARETWTWDWLGPQGQYQGDLTPYVLTEPAAQLQHDDTQAIQRTCRVSARSGLAINPNRDLLRPWYRLFTPDGGYLSWPLGTLTFGPPVKVMNEALTINQYTASDLSQLLVDSKFLNAFSIPGGTSYLAAIGSVIALLGGPTKLSVLIPDPGKALPAAMTWDADASLLKAVNDLLAAVNYWPAWFDEWGVMRSSPIPDYNSVLPDWTWDASAGQSVVISKDFQETPDRSSAANIVRVIGEDPRTRKPIVGYYENNRPDSPVGRVQWHDVVKVIRDSTIADQPTADARALTEGQAAARIYSNLLISTVAWPANQPHGVYNLVYQNPDEGLQDWNYLSVGWVMNCQVGAETTQTLQRIVPAS